MALRIHRRTALGAIALVPGLWSSRLAHAQARTQVLVVSQVPGGASDFYGRALAEHLGSAQGVPAIVQNRPGAAGEIAAIAVTGSAPDGNTLLVGTSSSIVVSPQVRPTRYDPRKDFRALGGVVVADTLMVAGTKRRFATLDDIIRFARAQPGTLTYASNGVGGAFHLAMEYFQSLAGIKLLHVPFQGASQGELAVLSGQIDLMVTNTASALPHIQRGTMVPVAVVGSAPSQELPDVPLASTVLPGFIANTWLATYGPAALPDGRAAELHGLIERYFAGPAGVAFLRTRGFIHVPSTLAQADAWTASEARAWQTIIAAARKNGPIE